MHRVLLAVLGVASLCACSGASDDGAGPSPVDPGPPPKAAELGTGDHTASSVTLTVIAGPGQRLAGPRDLAFNPRVPAELWVVNAADDSAVIIHDAPTDDRKAERRKDADARHFMNKPSAIAFGRDETSFGIPGTFATCGESRNEGDPRAPDFMGPTLWSSDLSIFAVKNPTGLGSHIDMLHESPLCMGIAHETQNVYWTFSGRFNAIVKFDFGQDHDIGQDDHTDGKAYQYLPGQVKYVPKVPSGLFFRDEDSMLYVADTGNARIAKLDTTSGTRGARIANKEPSPFYKVDGAVMTDVVTADSGLLEAPSGIEIKGDYLYVTDNSNGRISAFTFEGERVNWLDTGLPAGSLGGLSFGPDGKIYFVDMLGNQVLRIDPK